MAITPNMGMDVPTVSITLGPEWAQKLNNLIINNLDTHDHSTGKGVKITPAGMNINTDFSVNTNNINLANSIRFISNGAVLTDPADLRSVYVVNGDLYYNNGAGTPVQITAGTSVQSSSDGISRSFESVSVASNTTINPSDTYSFIQADTTTSIQLSLPPANAVANGRFYFIKDVTGIAGLNNITLLPNGVDEIDGVNASVVIDSNNGALVIVSDGASGWFVTDKKVTAAVSVNEGIPVYDGVGGFLKQSPATIDSSGNLVTTGNLEAAEDVIAGDDLIVTNEVTILGTGNHNVTSQFANQVVEKYTRPNGTSVGLRGVAISATWTDSRENDDFGTVGDTVTLTTTGRPVFVGIFGSKGDFLDCSQITVNSESDENALGFIRLRRDSTTIGGSTIQYDDELSTENNRRITIPPSSVWAIDIVAAGTYVYRVQAATNSIPFADSQIDFDSCRLVAFEL